MYNQSKLRVNYVMETLKITVSLDHLHDDDEDNWGDPTDMFDDEDDYWFDDVYDEEFPDQELLVEGMWGDEEDDSWLENERLRNDRRIW